MRVVGLTILSAGLLVACAPAPVPEVSRDQAFEICTDEALRRGAPEMEAPFGPDRLRRDAGLPPFDGRIPRVERETVFITCFHRLTGELPGDQPFS